LFFNHRPALKAQAIGPAIPLLLGEKAGDEGELNHRGRQSALIFFPISVPLRLCGKNPLLSAPHPWLKTSFLPNEPKLKIIKHYKSIGCENAVWLRFQNEPIFTFGESLCVSKSVFVCLPCSSLDAKTDHASTIR
jgi:hypothetical protein